MFVFIKGVCFTKFFFEIVFVIVTLTRGVFVKKRNADFQSSVRYGFVRTVSWIAVSSAIVVVASCGKKATSADPEEIAKDFIGTDVSTDLENDLAAAYPIGLSFSSITTVEGQSTSLADTSEGVPVATGDTSEGVINAESESKPPKEKAEETAAIIDADKPEQCRPVLLVRNLTAPDCYAKGVTATASATQGVDSKGTAVDNITIPTTLAPLQEGGSDRGIRFGDSGVIQDEQNGNACLADTAGYYVNTTAETVERATGLIASALCAAKAKNKGKLPGVNERVDLTKEVSQVWNLPKTLKVERFTIARVDKGGEGKDPVFRTVLKVKYKAPKPMPPPGQGGVGPEVAASELLAGDIVNLSAGHNPFAETPKPPPPGGGKPPLPPKAPPGGGKPPLPPKVERPSAPPGLFQTLEDRTLTVDLVNNPNLKNGDQGYKGRILVFETGRTGPMGPGVGAGAPKKQVRGVAIGYRRDADSIKYRFQSADFNTGESRENSPLKFMDLKTGFFNFKAVAQKSGAPGMEIALASPGNALVSQGPGHSGGMGGAPKRVVDNAVAGSVTLDVKTQTGRLAYHWQASLGDKAARSFVVNTKKEADGSISGCGLAGFSGQFGTEKQGQLQGFYCGWGQKDVSGTALDATIHPAVQQQCFTQAAAGGKWVLDPDQNKINFTVAQDCGQSVNTPAAFNLVAISSSNNTEKVATPEVTDAETTVAAPVDEKDLGVPAE